MFWKKKINKFFFTFNLLALSMFSMASDSNVQNNNKYNIDVIS